MCFLMSDWLRDTVEPCLLALLAGRDVEVAREIENVSFMVGGKMEMREGSGNWSGLYARALDARSSAPGSDVTNHSKCGSHTQRRRARTVLQLTTVAEYPDFATDPSERGYP